MISALQAIIRGALERLSVQIQRDLPAVLAAAAILLIAFLAARVVRWLVLRAVKGIEWDLWLRRSGLSGMLARSGTLRVSLILAHAAYWCILVIGLLAALNALSTEFTLRVANGIEALVPRLAAAAAIVVAGIWLGQYLARSALIWAVNEDLPAPRRLALAVRVFMISVAVVAAADTLNFAAGVFLSAFVLVLGGAALAAGISIGVGGSEAVRRYVEDRRASREERSLWNHL